MTPQEKQAVEDAAKNNTVYSEDERDRYEMTSIDLFDIERDAFIAGAQFLDNLRKPSEPETNVGEAEEELVNKISNLICDASYELDGGAQRMIDVEVFDKLSKEIAALMQPDKELLEALKDVKLKK